MRPLGHHCRVGASYYSCEHGNLHQNAWEDLDFVKSRSYNIYSVLLKMNACKVNNVFRDFCVSWMTTESGYDVQGHV